MGKLREARALFEQALQTIPRSQHPYLMEDCMVRLGYGEVLYYQNELEAAEKQFREALTKGVEWLNLEDRVPSAIIFARLLWATKRPEEARNLLEETRILAEHIQQPLALSWLRAAQAWLELKEGKLEAARHWAQTENLALSNDIPFYLEFVYKVLAQVWTQQGQYQNALSLLETLRHAAETTERTLHLVEILLLELLVYQKQGDTARAHTLLLRALHLAEPIGLIQSFAEPGEGMTILLKQVLEFQQRGNIPEAHKVSVHYLQTLLAVVPKASGVTPSTAHHENLSERELEVLRLIAKGLSNKAIAKRLELAPSTVKWYVNELFGKLEVSSRTQAIARAHTLHLV
jgi:LuxR family transcriptional regulator, maltose regulon positive regulatory protein